MAKRCIMGNVAGGWGVWRHATGGGVFLWAFLLLVLLLTQKISAELSNDGKILLSLVKDNPRKLGCVGCISPGIRWESWNESDDNPCRWIGVSCTSELTVYRLDFSAWSLTGIRGFSSLSSLESLEELDLSSNDLNLDLDFSNFTRLKWLDLSGMSGAGFPEISALRDLRYLNIDRSNLAGNIPSLAGFVELQLLSLSGNSLSGRIPELRNLTKLVRLDLSHNQLSGSIPNLEGLTSLFYLSLASNNLTGDVPDVQASSRLQYLYLDSNNLTGIKPSVLQNSSLQYVNISRNQLQGALPDTLSPIVSLDLSRNQLEGTIPPIPLFTVALDLSWNRLSGHLPSGLQYVNGRLDLSNNRLSGEIPGDVRSADPDPCYVDLSGNELNGSIPRNLLSAPCTYLNLSGNSLVGNIPEFYAGSYSHNVLDLSDNQLDGPLPSTFSTFSLVRRKYLGLQNNQLSGDVIQALALGKPSYTRVQGNRFTGDLTNFVQQLQPSSSIEVLDLRNNHLNMTPTSEHPNALQTLLEYAPGMKELGLAGNNLVDIALPGRLNNSLDLQVLDLGSCNLGGGMEAELFTSLPNLTYFNVSNNRLSGPIAARLPVTLQVLDVSNSNLEGEIPAELFTGLPTLLHFNASNNRRLSGPIPSTLPASLRILDLSHSNLQGQIPGKLFFGLPNLEYIDLSNNLLWGPLPNDLPDIFSHPSLFANNAGLCGGPLPPCLVPIPKQSGIRLWQLLTLVAAAGVVSTGSCLLLAWRWRVYSRKHQQDAELIATLLERDTVTVMPLRDLRRATANFSHSSEIGAGGFGTVYAGQLADGTAVAIKRSKREGSPLDKQQFLNEVRILSQVNHRNLVKLLGCSMENKIALLVFEYVPNGTLQDHLRGKMGGKSRLTWRQRLQIAVHTAEALAYLHSAAQPPIFHRDVKSANILLDENLNAKVADFGISKLAPHKGATHVSTAAIQGTFGYIDPEYYSTLQLTSKSDVYSFGAVLMELISAKSPVNLLKTYEESSLVDLTLSVMDKGEWEKLIDPVLMQALDSAAGKASIESVAYLALNCLAVRSRDRPDMREVRQQLQTIFSDAPLDHATNIQAQIPSCADDASGDSMSLLGSDYSKDCHTGSTIPNTSSGHFEMTTSRHLKICTCRNQPNILPESIDMVGAVDVSCVSSPRSRLVSK